MSAKLLATIFLSFISIPVLAQRVTEDQFLVAPYLQFSTKTGMYILWETREAATSRIDFSEAMMKDKKPRLDQHVTLSGTRLMHELFLSNLKPETNYFWQATSVTAKGDTIRSGVYTFKTAVNDSSAYMFALVGDTQRNDRTPWAWGKISALVWQDRPNFVVHAGDIVDAGLDKSDWLDNFFPNSRPLINRVPLFTVLGNHEQDAPYYYQYMVAPAPEYYYTFTYGNAQFFMIDTNRDVTEGSDQYNWLERELAKSKATWKIAIHHHPPYSSDSDDHGDTKNALSTLGTHARNLVPLYEQYGLDLCLFGHTHLYERSWPIKEDKINMKNGVVYINSGGAGGNLEDFAPKRSWFTQELQAVHHYCTFNVFENNLSFKAIDHEGKMIDAFQMTKPEADKSQARIIQPPVPIINTTGSLFENETNVKLEAAFEGLEIRYTLDGTEPSRNSVVYSQPLKINKTTTLSTRAYSKDGKASRLNKMQLTKMAPQPAAKLKKTEPGVRMSYYEGVWSQVPDFSKLKPVKSGMVKQIGLSEIGHRNDEFGVVLEGYVEVAKTGVQTFYLNSDDGAKLYINDVLVVDHDGDHSAIKKMGQTILAQGKHKIRIEYIEVRGSQFLQAGMVQESMGAVPFAAFQLSH